MIDLPLCLDGDHTFTISPTVEIPEVMQCAISLLFFTNDKTFRPMTDIGDSIYEMLAHITESNVEYVAALLGDLALEIREALTERFPNIEAINFVTDATSPNIKISLNIELDNETITQQIYEVN
jgi:hypothetical protein